MAIAVGADRRASTGVRAGLARARRAHPEWWVYGLAALAWVALAVGPGDHAGSPALPGLAASSILMSLAMMAPMAAPAARYVALAGRANRRMRGPVLFVGAFVAAWSAASLAIMAVVGVAAAVIGPLTTLLAVTAGAAAWHRSAQRRRTLARCGSHEPMGRRGWRADRAAATFGLRAARTCATTCGGLMAVAIAAGHPLLGLAALLAVEVHDRTERWPDPRVGMGVLVGVAGFALATGFGPLAAGAAAGSGDPVVGFVCRVVGVPAPG